jgi:hypothetical protein
MLQKLNTVDLNLDEAEVFKMIDGFEALHKQWCEELRKEYRKK